MNDAEKILTVLSKSQLNFIEAELGTSAEQIKEMTDDSVFDMYEKVSWIEVDETITAEEERNGKYSDRERMAEGIVTLIGNTLYRQEDEPE